MGCDEAINLARLRLRPSEMPRQLPIGDLAHPAGPFGEEHLVFEPPVQQLETRCLLSNMLFGLADERNAARFGGDATD